MSEKKSTWDVVATVRVTHRVCFEHEVTKEEAMELFEDGDFEDIIDEKDHETVEVESAK